MDCLGKPICETAHRAEYTSSFLEKNLEAPVTAEDIEKIATSVHGLYKNVDHKVYRVYLNKSRHIARFFSGRAYSRRPGKARHNSCIWQFKRGRKIMKIALIMLAAGNSRRFGSNKLLYEIEGKPMYRHILEKLMIVAEWLEETECIEKVECGEHLEKQNEEGYKEEHIECNKVIAPLGEIKGKLFKQRECYKRITVVTQYEEIEQAARSMGVNVYINPHPDEGISSSLKIGLKANLDVDACLFTVSDQPCSPPPQFASSSPPKNISKGIAVSLRRKLGNPCIFYKKKLRLPALH